MSLTCVVIGSFVVGHAKKIIFTAIKSAVKIRLNKKTKTITSVMEKHLTAITFILLKNLHFLQQRRFVAEE